MRGRFGLVVVALAAAVLVTSASDSLAGRRHRSRGDCSSCQTVEPTSCSTCTVPAPADAEAASIDNSSAEAPPSVAKVEDKQPTVPAVSQAPQSRTYYVSRRGRRRSRR